MKSHEITRMRIDYLKREIQKYPVGKIIDYQGSEAVYVKNHPTKPQLKQRRIHTSTKLGQQLKEEILYRQTLEDRLKQLETELKMLNTYTIVSVPRPDERFKDGKKFWEYAKFYADSNNAFPKPDDGPVYKGTKFRSKSEMTIAVSLDNMGIEYVYEPQLFFNMKTFYPDFVIYIPEIDKVIIIEHFGRMRFLDYRNKNAVKMKDYLDEGLVEGRDIIFTFEYDTAGLDVTIFENKVNAAILTNLMLKESASQDQSK